MVFNHKDGGDYTEDVETQEVSWEDRNCTISDWYSIKAWTGFTFEARGDRYSSYKWHWWHFDAGCPGQDYTIDQRQRAPVWHRYSPVAPSMASRMRSACPLWRAVSSIKCSMIHRSVWSPPGGCVRGRRARSSRSAADVISRERATCVRYKSRIIATLSSLSTRQSASGSASVHGKSTSSPANTFWNHQRST